MKFEISAFFENFMKFERFLKIFMKFEICAFFSKIVKFEIIAFFSKIFMKFERFFSFENPSRTFKFP